MNKTAYDKNRMYQISEEMTAMLRSGDPSMIKNASLAADEYFRTEIRENGLRRLLTPPSTVTPDSLTYDGTTDLPVKWVEVEPSTSGAYSVPFEAGTTNDVLMGRKARIDFKRIFTNKISFDMERLNGYKMPLLDIIRDKHLKSIMDEEDSSFKAVDDYILGTINENRPEFGCRRYINVGAMSRDSFVEATKAMIKTEGHLIASKAIMNYSTYLNIAKLKRDIIGGDAAEDMFFNGVTTKRVAGLDIITTTKTDMYADNEMYIYTDPEYYGYFGIKDDISLVSEVIDGIWMSSFMWEVVGGAVINAAGVAKVVFDGTMPAGGWDNV